MDKCSHGKQFISMLTLNMRVALVLLLGLQSITFARHHSEEAEQQDDDDGSYSYHKFRGPVSGEVQKVVVPSYHHPRSNGNQQGYHHQSLDYVAKPDYTYAYGVQDPVKGNSQNHQESRDGDAVRGEYRVLQPDGFVRVVKYVADGENGFQATVTYEKA